MFKLQEPPTIPVHQTNLPRSQMAPALARMFIEERHRDELSRQALADAKVVTSELVTNAIKHGAGRIRLRCQRRPYSLRIEVIDEGTGELPAVRDEPGDETGGFGLRIVDALSRQWGTHAGSTHVWADVPAG